MSTLFRARLRHLASFGLGSGVGLVVDLGGFWSLVRIGLPPGVANALSSGVSIVVVYLLVTRRTFRVRTRPATFLLFAAWYALNIATVSVLIDHAVTSWGHRPLLWKLASVPLSFSANYVFNLLLHRPRGARLIGRAAAAAVVLIALGIAVAPASTATARPADATSSRRRLSDLLAEQPMFARSIVVGGLGSSVGVGATLQDPARDAPVAYFASTLQRQVDPSGLAAWRTRNGSVSGSTIHDGLARDWAVLERAHPDVVVLAYGMNDGAPAQFTQGETYAGAMHDLVQLIADIRASGAVPVILTSPSPHTDRIDWSVPPGPNTPQQTPVDTTDPVRQVQVPRLGRVPESTRHAAIDAGMRGIARTYGVDLIDVEPFWLRAVAERGQNALFNPHEFVHPDLLGHRLSYHAAIDAWLRSGAAVNALSTAPFRNGGV